jgi:hypothetical protein
MKLLRYGPMGEEKPGILDADGTIRDLSSVIADLNGAALSPAALKLLAALDPRTLPAVAARHATASPSLTWASSSPSASTTATTPRRPRMY